MDSLKEMFQLLPERYADFVQDVVGGLEILLLGVLIGVVIVYLGAMFIAMGGRTAKFTKRIAACNKELSQIKLVDKSNRRIFYGILNKAPVSIKKSWENYEYFKANRAVDYFNRTDLLASNERSGCGSAILMAFNFMFPAFICLSVLTCTSFLGWATAAAYTCTVLVLEFVLYIIASLVKRSRYNKCEEVLDKFLENLNAKANIHGSGDKGKTLNQLAEKTILGGNTISNVAVEDKSRVLNDNLVDKAIGNKSLNKNERQAIVDSIESQKQINRAINEKKSEQSTILQPKSYWSDNSSPIDSILEEIEQMKKNGSSMKEIQRLLEALQVEKAKPNKSDEDKKKLNSALNELLQILSKEKNKKA